MQVMALRSAKNGGLHVPDQTLKRAIEYIHACYDERTGGYGYQPYTKFRPGFARHGIAAVEKTGFKECGITYPCAIGAKAVPQFFRAVCRQI